MKKAILCKYKFSILFDFIILLIIFTIFAFSIFFVKNVLFNSLSSSQAVVFKTEPIPISDIAPPDANDILYDPVTKRKIGKVTSARPVECDGSICFLITADITTRPRTKSLRTAKIWFRFSELEPA